MELSSVGTIVFGLYLGVLVVVGIAAFGRQKTAADFWVAGRRFGLGMMITANVAAMMHGGAIMSHLGFAAQVGGVAITNNLPYALGFAVILVFFAKKLRSSEGFTLPDYMGSRFGSRFLRGWSAVVVAITSVIYLIAQIRAMGFVLERLLGVPVVWGQLIGTAIFVGYVTLGGLLAVVWTSVAQFVVICVGLAVVGAGVYENVGGFSEVLVTVESAAPGWTSPTGVSWTWTFLLSWYLLVLVGYSTRLELVTKVFAARDHRIARRALPWTALAVMVLLTYTGVYLGAAARVLVWNDITTADQAFPALVALTLSPAMAAVALTAVACAIMSTTDSLLLMSGAAVAHDLLRKCVHEPRGSVRDEAYYLRVSRYAVVVVGAIAYLGSTYDVALILELVAYALAIVGSSFFLPLLVGLTSPRLGRESAIASCVGGGVTAATWTGLTVAGVGWASSMHPILPGLAVSAGLMLALAPASTPAGPDVLADFFPDQFDEKGSPTTSSQSGATSSS